MAKFSIIIPVYNVEKYLAECLESVIQQTFKDIEIICVNDGSTDNSLEILTEFAQKDTRIKLINKENGGLSSARNTGLQYATCEYIYFLDSDDFIKPDLFENAYNVLKNNDVDCYCFSSEAFTEDEAQNKIYYPNKYLRVKNTGLVKCDFKILQRSNIQVWNKIFRLSLINKYGIRFIDKLLFEDIFFTWAYFFISKKAYFEPRIFHKYRIRNNSIMSISNAKKDYNLAISHLYNWHELILFLEKHDDIFEKNFKNLMKLLKKYNKNTISMVNKPDIKRVKHQHNLYKKELNKKFRDKFGIIKFLIAKLSTL
jgi:glycosyltransferase involved in cell wall biosynthesis